MDIPAGEELRKQELPLPNLQMAPGLVQISKQVKEKKKNENEVIVSLIFLSQLKLGRISRAGV